MLGILSGPLAYAQAPAGPDIANVLLAVSPEDKSELPTPSKLNPSYWNFPAYAKTPFLCVGDDVIGQFVASRFSQRRGQINFHAVSQGFLSVTISDSDINTVDSVELDSTARERLRTMLKWDAKELDSGQRIRQTLLYVLNNPLLQSKLSPKATKLVTWSLYLGGIALDQTIERSFSDVKTRLTLLASQLQSQTTLYRSVVSINSSAEAYIRYLYAVVPQSGELTVLRTCTYARHSTEGPR